MNSVGKTALSFPHESCNRLFMATRAPNPLIEQEEAVTRLRSAFEAAKAAFEREEAVLIGMRRMAAFANIAAPTPRLGIGAATRLAAVNKGRQKGAISMRWRMNLWRLDEAGGGFSPEDVAAWVKEIEGREMRPIDAKRQMDGYAELGYVRMLPDGRYDVTDEFRLKFPAGVLDGPSDEEEPSE